MIACAELDWFSCRHFWIKERYAKDLLDLVSQQALPQYSRIQTID